MGSMKIEEILIACQKGDGCEILNVRGDSEWDLAHVFNDSV